MWCCVGTGMENHSKYGVTIYSHNDSTLWVNLFIPSELDWKEQGVTIRQETNFPDDDTMDFSIATTSPKKFTMRIRVPYWATDGASVWINGRQEEVQAKPQSYLALSRTWQDGEYYFATTSDDGSALSLAGTEIVKNDGIHAMVSIIRDTTISAKELH